MNTIYYYTATGNCLMAAGVIAEALGDTKLVRITDKVDRPAASSDAGIIGIVFPVYCGNAPVVIQDFVENLSVSPETFLFVTATHGGHAVIAIPQIAEILNRKGIVNYRTFELEMVHNGVFIAPVPSDGEVRNKLDAAYKEAEDIAEIVRKKEPYPIMDAAAIIEKVSQNPMAKNVVFSFDPAVMYKDFYTDEKCDGCGLCSQVCPMSNITMLDAKPAWHDKCQLCLACLQWCPKQAIQYVHNHIAEHTSVGKKRYHNPDVDLKTILSAK